MAVISIEGLYTNILLLYNITFFPITLIAVCVYEETNTR